MHHGKVCRVRICASRPEFHLKHGYQMCVPLSVCSSNFHKSSWLCFGCRSAELMSVVFFPADVSALCRHLRSLGRASSVFACALLARKWHLWWARWPRWHRAVSWGGCVMVPMHRGSPPRRGAPHQPLLRRPRQQGGSAHPCKFGVKLGGSLLCLVLLERAGAEHQPPLEPETNKQTPLPFLSRVCKCKHGSGNGKLGFPQPKNVKSDIRLEGVA